MRMPWVNWTAPALIAVLGLIALACGGAAVNPTTEPATELQSAAGGATTVEETAKTAVNSLEAITPVVVLPTTTPTYFK